ncbi:hypothetical protein ACFQ2B_01205 [Streptomyces stramineus]
MAPPAAPWGRGASSRSAASSDQAVRGEQSSSTAVFLGEVPIMDNSISGEEFHQALTTDAVTLP